MAKRNPQLVSCGRPVSTLTGRARSFHVSSPVGAHVHQRVGSGSCPLPCTDVKRAAVDTRYLYHTSKNLHESSLLCDGASRVHPPDPASPCIFGCHCSRREKEGARVATQFTSPFYLQELAGGLNFPVGAHGFRGPVVWRRLVAGRRGGRKVVFFP